MKDNVWKPTTQLIDMRYYFSVCSFKQNLFVIGGSVNKEYTNMCLKYDTKLNKWSSIAPMSDDRSEAACTVFDGKIVWRKGTWSE